MAVNNDCPGCQPTYGQSSSTGNNEQDGNVSRSRAVSPENGRSSPTIYNPYYTGRPRTPANGAKSSAIDRQELIRRIKSGSRPASPELERPHSSEYSRLVRIKSRESRPVSPEIERPASNGGQRKRRSPVSSQILPEVEDARPQTPEVQQDNQAVGLQIERPRSALHRGDFREQTTSSFEQFGNRTPIREEHQTVLSTSPVVPWHPAFPAAFRQLHEDTSITRAEKSIPVPRPERPRAVSNASGSLAGSFIYKPPTSPLVQSSRPDTPEPPLRDHSRSPDKSRRHTFSPRSFQRFQSSLDYPTTARVAPPLRSEKTFPYQAHQPRRSVNPDSPYVSLPQSPFAGPRRPSITDSPLHHAPLVGSYEESILRGRMSTTPSKPLNFMAQIGVLGKGDCKANLKCPPHVQVPFPAVFYSYGGATKTPALDQPSPYVGLVDLENNLPNPEQARDRRRERVQATTHSNTGSRASSPAGSGSDATRRRKRTKQKRRSGSPKAPPGGSYRIPQQGQLQIVLKNPNKTAVKLFLVPYDLSDMEAGQKTFIRQRSYSAGPIIDMPLTSRANYGTDRPEASLSPTGDPNDRPMLRYLIHLHVCCPSKGRYFLYKSVRVVFANRVPDGKEKLRNEIQLPEPRYSAYKPGRESHAGSSVSTPMKDDSRRRSALDPAMAWPAPAHLAQSMPTTDYTAPQTYDVPMPTLPRHFTTLPTLQSRPASRSFSDNMDVDSGSQGTRSPMSPTSTQGDEMTRSIPSLDDPFVFERDRSRERRSGTNGNESLLSKRLMDLAFQKQREMR